MAYAPHTLFVFGGRLLAPYAGAENEIWECTIRGIQLDKNDGPVNDPAAFLQGVKDPMAAWFASPNSAMINTATLDYIKANNIGPDGRYVNKSNTNRLDYAVPIVGATSPAFPDVLTVAWSWRSDKTRGPGSHGRIYPPNMCTADGVKMTITQQQQAYHLSAAQKLLKVLQDGDHGTNAMWPCISSKVNGTNTKITTIVIGNVIDMQRRRKSAEKESYVSGHWSV